MAKIRYCWVFLLLSYFLKTGTDGVSIGTEELFQTELVVADPIEESTESQLFERELAIVSIHLNYDHSFVCSGVIVSYNKVISLAHCLYYSFGAVLPPIIVEIKAGGISSSDLNIQTYDVDEIDFHENFDLEKLEYNLAVIEISSYFPLDSSVISPIAIPQNIVTSYNKCVVTGWNQNATDVQIASVNLIDCGTVTTGKLCAIPVYENNSLCLISLGSSLVCDGNLLGLLAIIPPCTTTDQILIFESSLNARQWLNNATSSSTSDIIIPINHKPTVFNLILTIFIFVIALFL